MLQKLVHSLDVAVMVLVMAAWPKSVWNRESPSGECVECVSQKSMFDPCKRDWRRGSSTSGWQKFR